MAAEIGHDVVYHRVIPTMPQPLNDSAGDHENLERRSC